MVILFLPDLSMSGADYLIGMRLPLQFTGATINFGMPKLA